MNHALLRWTAALLPSLLTSAARAQEAPRPTPKPAALGAAMRSACGLQQLDGTAWGIGRDYKAAFRGDGVEYTPALGGRAPRNFPVTLRTAAVGRESHPSAVGNATPRIEGLRASYERTSFVEQYDVTAGGIAQSFVFDRVPTGSGDLVVQLALTTDLPLVAQDEKGLRFELPDLGGVAIGGVTGIDAKGHRVAGTITCDGRTVELRLPEHFVDRAALPLVLDPQIGTVFAVTNSTLDYQSPELVAPYAGGGTYLCVFEREISATDRDVRGIRLNSDGTIAGALFAITTGTGDDRNPTAGGIAVRSAWVVVYGRAGDLFVRSVSSSGVVGPEYTAVSGTDNQIEPDLGSEITTIDDDAVLVFRNSTLDAIQATNVTMFSSGLIATAAPLTIGSGISVFTVGRPRIAHDGGDIGRYLVVYPRTQSFGDSKPQLVLVDRDVNVLATLAATSTTNDEDSAVVDGNGRFWTVAFESEANEGTGDNDILAVPVYYDEAGGVLLAYGARTVTALANVDEVDPAIACFRDGSCMIAWRRRAAPGSSDTEVFMKTIDQLGCQECEPTVLLANSTDIETNLTAAASAQTNDQGLMLWETSTASGGNGDLDGVAWDAEDGSLSPFPLSVAPGCSNGTVAVAGCARVGNPNFLVQVHGTPSSSLSTFLLSTGTSQVMCNGCRLYADPFGGLAFYPVAGLGGLASFQLSVPDASALRGMTFYVQWLVQNPAAQCTWLGADFSNALAITIE